MDEKYSQAFDRGTLAQATGFASGALHRWWGRLLTLSRGQRLAIGCAAVAAIGLLLAFHAVVSAAVEQGEQRRAAVAARNLAIWRCSTLAGAAPRSNCVASVGAPPPLVMAGMSER